MMRDAVAVAADLLNQYEQNLGRKTLHEDIAVELDKQREEMDHNFRIFRTEEDESPRYEDTIWGCELLNDLSGNNVSVWCISCFVLPQTAEEQCFFSIV